MRWKRRGRSLSAKLIALIFSAMVVIFALLGYANIRLHRQHLEAATLTSAERVSDVIKRSTSYHMLRNDREALYQTINTMADEPGIVQHPHLRPGGEDQLFQRRQRGQHATSTSAPKPATPATRRRNRWPS